MTETKTSAKGLLATAALLLVSLLVSSLLGEGILRLLGYRGVPESLISNMRFVEDPILDWRYLPNSQVVIGKITNQYNSRGFRDVEHNIDHTTDMKRLVVIGDSVTEGYGVESDAMFVRQLQAKLGARYDVINLGMAGLNTPQEVHLFEIEGLQYKPHLVILNFVLNDADFFTTFRGAQRAMAEADQTIGLLNMRVDPRLKRLLKSSALIYFLKDRVENIYGLATGRAGQNYYGDLWSKEESREKIRSGFARLSQLKESYGFEVLVVVWPVLIDYQKYPFISIHHWIGEEARKNRFLVIDLLPEFSKFNYRDLQVTAEDNIHPNAIGHKIAADIVVKLNDHFKSLLLP